MINKGIILAGGKSTRLFPATTNICKQLLPVYNKPMIYYPLSTLMLAGITEVLIIINPDEQGLFEKLLGDGSQLGISISYAIQDQPRGLAEAFIIGEEFIDGDAVTLILGDNIFYGEGLGRTLQEMRQLEEGARILAYYVNDPENYGVVEFDADGRAINIEEKPTKPKSSYAVPGLYFFDKNVCQIARKVTPSARGELEITSIIQTYLDAENLEVMVFGRGIAWLDTGTHDSLLEASNFVASVERRQGLMIASPEEIAFRYKLISREKLLENAQKISKTVYGQYLIDLANDEKHYIKNDQY